MNLRRRASETTIAQETGILDQHSGDLHKTFPAVADRPPSASAALSPEITADFLVHLPSLVEIAWTLSFVATTLATFPDIPSQQPRHIVQFLLGGVDITTVGCCDVPPTLCRIIPYILNPTQGVAGGVWVVASSWVR
ncbi:hypothetical protein DFH27DRAFT_529587 [Peziza echinospora]|nr:hypothetical protein DFH27DRAFT_529587 [Peziza echinospora]